MRMARLDGRQRSKRAVLRKLARDLGFPDHFGGNLDALFDVLAHDVKGPMAIRWRTTAAGRTALGRDYLRIADTLTAAAALRDDITVEIR